MGLLWFCLRERLGSSFASTGSRLAFGGSARCAERRHVLSLPVPGIPLVFVLTEPRLQVAGGGKVTRQTRLSILSALARLYSTQDLFLSTFVPGDSNLWHKAKAG